MKKIVIQILVLALFVFISGCASIESVVSKTTGEGLFNDTSPESTSLIIGNAKSQENDESPEETNVKSASSSFEGTTSQRQDLFASESEESPIVESSVESANSTNQETTSQTTNMSEFESSEKQQMDKNGILFIDGKEIEFVCVFNKETREAELPLLTIVKELGAKVEWLNSTNVCISYDGNEIELDTEEDGFGIYPPPGTIGAVRKVEQNEIIMDSTSINALIVYWFHHKVDVDFDKNVVNVVEHHIS